MRLVVTLTPAEQRAFDYCDAFSWHSYWADNPHEQLMEENELTAEELAVELAAVAESSYVDGVLTLIPESQLFGDVMHMLETKTTGFCAVIAGPARVRVIRRIIAKLEGGAS